MRAWVICVLLALAACDRGGEMPARVEADRAASFDGPAAEPTTEPEPAPEMIGVLVPEAEVVLVAGGFGRLERLDLELGDHVRAGEVVAELDVRGDRSELSVATAAWRASKAELERLELELEQARATRGEVEQLEDYVSKAELREQRFAEQLAAARKRSAGATLEQQRSKISEAEARIEAARLRAPFDGVVARRLADPGATLALGEPVVELISDARLIRFAVPEQLGDALVLGAAVRVRFEQAGVELVGEVSSIAPEIEAGSRLVIAEARVELGPEHARLRVGAVGRVRFQGTSP